MTAHGDAPPRLAFLLTTAERGLRRWVDARAGDDGIGAAGAGVLFHLASNEHALVGDVTAALHASPSGMSGLLGRLTAAGLVRKSADPDDGRAVRLSLTEQGRRSLGPAHEVLAELNGHLTDGFTSDELRVVGRWLTHVSDSLQPGER
jgi:DNA-binding MarR family transcriptional regulator